MFKTLTFKKKFIALLVGLPILLILVYSKTFSKTLEANKNLKELKSRLVVANRAKKDLIKLEGELSNLDAIIGKEVASPDIVQQEIFDIFSDLPYKVSLEKLEEAHKLDDAYFNVYTNNLMLKGVFNELLETTYYYEKEFQYSRVVSLAFFTKKDPKTKKRILFERVIFQNYDKK